MCPEGPQDFSVDAEGRLRWGSRAAGLLIERVDNGKILLLLRSDEVMDPGLWGIPGGRVELYEEDLEAAFAEVEEEVGGLPHVRLTGEVSISSGDFTYTTFFATMPGEIAKRWIPTLNWESDDWKWFSPKRLPKNVHPGIVEALRQVK